MFDEFKDRDFVSPPDFEPRPWQLECLSSFSELAALADPYRAQPMAFTIYAGVGSGKTYMAAMIASRCLRRGLVDRIVYVAPNRAIAHEVRSRFKQFQVHLAAWSNRRHRNGEGAMNDGCVMTYQSMSLRPGLQRDLANRKKTLVVFDEIHHLGDNQRWGEAAEDAFGKSAFVVGMTGTPFRSDGTKIPFATYLMGKDGLLRIVADVPHGYSYQLGRAIKEGWCRKPIFRPLNGTVEITPADGEPYLINFDNEEATEVANLRLAGAVRRGSHARRDALEQVIRECFGGAERRKLIIFVGGDSGGATSAIEDASIYLPAELASLGMAPSKIEFVTSDDDDAMAKISAFGKSDAEILISINMVSEGVDIPEVSAILLLTNITAVTTTVQRIGRALRKTGFDDPITTALIFFFADHRYVTLTTEIETQVRHFEVRDPSTRSAGIGERGVQPRRASALGLNAYLDGMIFNGKAYTREQVDAAHQYVVANGLAPYSLMLGCVLQIQFGDEQPRREAQ